jgi:hypothetical protein
MSNNQHGHFTIKWCNQTCLVVLEGAFNKQGAEQLGEAVKRSWAEAGSPTRWAHVVDMRNWEGGTPDSFAPAKTLANWTYSHGVAAIVRLHRGHFLPRVVDGQGVLEAVTVPVGDFSSPDEALRWLQAHQLSCEGCEDLLGGVHKTHT